MDWLTNYDRVMEYMRLSKNKIRYSIKMLLR
jgi:hypothetical protein